MTEMNDFFNLDRIEETIDAEVRQDAAEAKAKLVDQARALANESGDWDAFQALCEAQDHDDSDVPYAERGMHIDTAREPWLLHGLTPKRRWLTPDDASIYQHRLEVSDGLYEIGHPGLLVGQDARLLLPGFTVADATEFTSWRPWNVELMAMPLDLSNPMFSQRLTAMAKKERFGATLQKITDQHAERHWFFVHPFCRECFSVDLGFSSAMATGSHDSHQANGYANPNCTKCVAEHEDLQASSDHQIAAEMAEGRYASWLLAQRSETAFPGDDWDGVLPPVPVIPDAVDFMTTEDLDALPEPGWLIPDVLPDSGTGVLRARDQSFKSFMALDMALQVVTQGWGQKVLYCIGEGANNFKHRIAAWLEYNGERLEEDDTLDLLPAVPNLFTGGDLYDRVLAKARRESYDLIIIDTYARATSGSDVNSQGDQSIVTARVDELKRATGGTVLLVAHSQKSDNDASGSIEIEDARDFVFSMKRKDSTTVTFEVTKQKDGVESAAPLTYVTKPVGESIVLVEAGEEGPSIMTSKDWIVASLDNTKGLGGRTEAQIRAWINGHDHRDKPMTNGTCSSTLSRMVTDGQVTKSGSKYVLVTGQVA